MLNNIFDENWSELKTLTGTAEHVPHAVLGLLSENEQEFDASYWKLENHVVVQGELFDSAAVLPKYLEEVFIRSKFKHGVLELLFQIGNGTCCDKELQNFCYREVIASLTRLKNHPEIVNTELEGSINSEINELVEINTQRNNQI